MKKSRKIAQVGEECVACGCCVGVCPMQAIRVAIWNCGKGGRRKVRGLREMCEDLPGGSDRHRGEGGGAVKKKRWFDYLWIGELLYLILGLSNILFAWLGMLFFSIPLLVAIFGGSKAYCNRYCGRGAALGHFRRKAEAFKKCSAAEIFAQPLVSIRIFGLFYGDVRPDAVFHLPGFFRRAPSGIGNPFMGVSAAMAMGKGGYGGAVVCPICLWLFWCDADIHSFGDFDHDTVSAQVLVRVLPHGDNDPGNLCAEKRKAGETKWKSRHKR